MRSVLGVHWKDWCWSWSSNTLTTWCEELTHLKRPWCWERLRAGGEGDNQGWDGWMASRTRWTWVWVNSGSWWWTGRPGVLQFMGSERVGHYRATVLNRTEPIYTPQLGKNLNCLKTANVCEHINHLRTLIYCLYNILNWQINCTFKITLSIKVDYICTLSNGTSYTL